MDKQRILREARKIAAKFSFWMVSGNIAHLYGYVYETPDKKYELEIKFEENFPQNPPKFLFHDNIKELIGDVQLKKLKNWSSESLVVDIVQELEEKIQDALKILQKKKEKELAPIIDAPNEKTYFELEEAKKSKDIETSPETEEYITPDLKAYPPDFEFDEFITPSSSEEDLFYEDQSKANFLENEPFSSSKTELETAPQEQFEETSVSINTELGLIQQEYAYDQPGSKGADINVYITITLTKTFIISIDFMNYPERPIITFPEEVKKILRDPYKTLNTLREWSSTKPLHIVDILHELEKKLFFIKEIELQSKKISGEYQCEKVPDSITTLQVHLLTYGFKEYTMGIDLESYPNPPIIDLSSELQEIIQIPITELNAYKNWIEKESEPVEIIREISWLVDKNSRINFEIDLLKDHYKNIKYEPSTATLNVEMKGKMKTEDLTFEFQINLPIDYPMKMPDLKVINEFELEAHEKIKNDLHASFSDFFNEWTPFSYLVDLFNLISKKIFEVSVVSCVICHKIECPSCTKKIAGDDNCHAECPHCEKHYHLHCWQQTVKSFGKCGFCLKIPPPSMM